MSEQLKINVPDEVCLTTIRTKHSRLWFIKNKEMEEEILAYLAKYCQECGVILYAFIIMGNHYHMVAKFARGNRHRFKQFFNRIFSNILKRHIRRYKGGGVWARRYRPQPLLKQADVLNWFFYTVLNPVSSGIVRSIDKYEGFSSYQMSLTGETRTYRLIDWADYSNRKRYNKNLKPEDCEKEYTLQFSRLPGHENDTQEEYRVFLEAECTKRTAEKVKAREDNNEGFMTTKFWANQQAGDLPKHTKTSSRDTHRPLALSLSPHALAEYLTAYFDICDRYKLASLRYRKGHLRTKFPPGTFRPIMLGSTASLLA